MQEERETEEGAVEEKGRQDFITRELLHLSRLQSVEMRKLSVGNACSGKKTT